MGVGKSSLIGQFSGIMFYMWETALQGISTFRTPPLVNDIGWPRLSTDPKGNKLYSGWEKALIVTDALERDRKKVTGVCFDTGPAAYKRAMEFVCKRERISHPGEQEDFGASWGKVTDEYTGLQARLVNSGFSFVALSHEKLEELQTYAGKKFYKVKPNFGGAIEQYYRSSADIVAYMYKIGGQRWLQIVGDDYVTAKCNPENFFRTPNGDQVYRIPIGNSPKEAYASLMNAFNNKQEETYAEEVIGFEAVEKKTRSGKVSFSKPSLRQKEEKS